MRCWAAFTLALFAVYLFGRRDVERFLKDRADRQMLALIKAMYPDVEARPETLREQFRPTAAQVMADRQRQARQQARRL